MNKSTFLGTVQDVNGTTVRVVIANESLSGLTFVEGQGYRIGQVGSFVKILMGYVNLFGIVTQVGASAIPENQNISEPNENRWLAIELIGEGNRDGQFNRGISQYPTISDEVHLVSESDLKKIYGQPDKPYFVKVGHIASAESIPALIDINKLITRHSAIVGTTGSGKSTIVASLINALSNPKKYPSARIIILDIHGEYGKAMRKNAYVYKINADKKNGERELYLPFWALNFEELTELSFGVFSNEKDKNIILERILIEKKKSIELYGKEGVNDDNLNVDTPIPFNLNHLWYDLWIETFGTYYSREVGFPKDNLAFAVDSFGNKLLGNPNLGKPPIFKKVKNIKDDEEKINYLPNTLNIGQQLQLLGAKLRVPRFDFIFNPGSWSPEQDGKVKYDLDKLLKEWIGNDKAITILDLSGIPPLILNIIIGVLLRITYEALFWSRKLSEGGRNRPLLIVMEEAHNYLGTNSNNLASLTVQRIVKEGRKYGIGAMIVSQRPSEISPTILSQCGTFFALRLTNDNDRTHITSSITDNLKGLTSMLPILRTGEAIILGESVKLPMRTLIEAPPKEKRPDSSDPIIYEENSPDKSLSVGGWGIKRTITDKDYKEVLKVWRSQNPTSTEIKESKNMERIPVQSSNISSIGYNVDSKTLEIEFNDGSIYQYFDVPNPIWESFQNADSKGQFLHQNIKGIYRYSRV